MIQEEADKKSGNPKNLNRKRAVAPLQSLIYERNDRSELNVTAEFGGKKRVQDENFDLEAYLKKQKDEETFKKNFAKDKKMFDKVDQAEDKEKAMEDLLVSKKRGQPGGEILEKFMNGEITVDEYNEQKAAKKTTKTGRGQKKTTKLNKTAAPTTSSRGLMRFFGAEKLSDADPDEHEEEKKERNSDDWLGKPLCMGDILAELADPAHQENYEREQEEEKKAKEESLKAKQSKKQTNLRQFAMVENKRQTGARPQLSQNESKKGSKRRSKSSIAAQMMPSTQKQTTQFTTNVDNFLVTPPSEAQKPAKASRKGKTKIEPV